jgi:hypothetical protein
MVVVVTLILEGRIQYQHVCEEKGKFRGSGSGEQGTGNILLPKLKRHNSTSGPIR